MDESQLNCFLGWLNRFAHFSIVNKDYSSVLLIQDGHLTHRKSLAIIEFALDFSVVLLCLPPQQPLDVTFFKTLNLSHGDELQNWLHCNLGKVRTKIHLVRVIMLSTKSQEETRSAR